MAWILRTPSLEKL